MAGAKSCLKVGPKGFSKKLTKNGEQNPPKSLKSEGLEGGERPEQVETSPALMMDTSLPLPTLAMPSQSGFLSKLLPAALSDLI